MEKREKKLAYLPMAVDMIHPGHLNIIKTAASLGCTVMVGCYSDKAIASYKRLPFMNFEQRKLVVGSIKGVDIVVEQKTNDLEENIRLYKPDYVVHGTDWRDGALSGARERAIKILSEWGGQLVEPEYTSGISSSIAHMHLREIGTSPAARTARFRKLLAVKPKLRGMEVHNAISATIAETAVVKQPGKPIAEVDVFWLDEKSLAESKGKHDPSCVDFSEKRSCMNDIFEVTTKPLLFDGSSMVKEEQIVRAVKTLEPLGVSGIALTANSSDELLPKLHSAKLAQLDSDFMVLPKLEVVLKQENFTEIVKLSKEALTVVQDGLIFDADDICPAALKSIVVEIRSEFENVPIILLTSHENKFNESSYYNCDVSCVIYKDHMLASCINAMKQEIMGILEG